MYLDNPEKIKDQMIKIQKILDSFKTEKPSSILASESLNRFLK